MPIRDPEFLLAHAGFVRALAQRLVFDEHLARDVEQETWLAALEHAPSDPRSPKAWLARLVRNFALKAWRGRGRRQDRERIVGRDARDVPEPGEILERESARRDVVLAVLALDEPWRSALILRFLDEQPPREVARRLGVPVETARTRIKRGLELLRMRLERQEDGTRGAWALALVRSMRLEPASYGAAATAVTKSLIQGVLLVSAAQKVVLGIAATILVAASLWLVDHREPVEAPAVGSPDAVAPQTAPADPAVEAPMSDETLAAERVEVSNDRALEQPEPKLDPRHGSLLLHVVWGDDGTPAAHVGMCLYQQHANDYYKDSLLAETDDSGAVLVDPILAGRIQAYFDRGGGGEVTVEPGERAEATLRMPVGFDIEGRVLDADGRGVAGADIYLYGSLGDTYEGYVVAHSAEDGSYFVRSAESGGITYLSARAPMRAPTTQKIVMSVTGVDVKIDLVFEEEGGSIEGRALAPDGTPCVNAAVVLEPGNAHQPIVYGDGSEGITAAAERVFTDTKGHFRFAGVAEGMQPIQARASGFAPWKGEVRVVARRTTAIDIPLMLGSRLEGVVRDEGGAPVAGVRVTAGGTYGFASAFRTTRADGSFSMDGLPLGDYEAAVDADERGAVKATFFGESGVQLRWDAVLSKGLVLRGEIEAPGRELARWRLEVEAYDPVAPFQQRATTDAEGHFEVIGCPDAALRVTLYAPAGGLWPAAVVENVRAGHGELSIRADPALEPSVHIQGRVLDPEGEPLGGVQVLPWLAGFNRSPILTTEAATGRFQLGPYPPGEWVVRLKTAGFAEFVSERHTLGPNETWDIGDLMMSHGGRIVATVRREEGVDVRSGFLMLTSEAGTSESLQLEGDVARSGALSPGRYQLLSGGQHVALALREVEVRPDEETRIEVVLTRGVGVRVRFVDANESALDHALTYELFDVQERLQTAEIRPEYGPIEWTGFLAPGSYRFSARDVEQREGSLSFEVSAAATTLVEGVVRLR